MPRRGRKPIHKARRYQLGTIRDARRFLGLGDLQNQNVGFDDDVVFIAIDIEGSFDRRALKIKEIGVSKLDTRDIPHLANGSLSMAPEDLIKTCTFSPQAYGNRARMDRKRFFGDETQPCPLSQMRNVLREVFCISITPNSAHEQASNAHPDPLPKFRNVVIVGHMPHIDLYGMLRLGFCPEDLFPVVGILDTNHLHTDVLGGRGNLETLLGAIGCPNHHLHHSGNDSNFTLRAMLGLVVASCGGLDDALAQPANSRLATLQSIVLAPLPNAVAKAERCRRQSTKELWDTLDSDLLLDCEWLL